MEKKVKEKKKTNKKGRQCRPTKYDPVEFPKRAEEFARMGLSDEQICHNLGISHQTYYMYQKKHPEFKEAIKRGKAPVDFEVENALLQRALGYEYTEKHTTKKVVEGVQITETKEIIKHYPGDTTAQIFWLKHRKPDQWMDKSKIELSGKVENEIIWNEIKTYESSEKEGDE